MAIKVAINGFGRIGRLILRAIAESGRKDVTVVGDPTNTQLIPDVTVHPVSVLYAGLYRQQDNETGFQIGLSKNWPGGNDGQDTAFCASRKDGVGLCAGASYTIWRWGFNHNRALPGDCCPLYTSPSPRD